MTLRTLVISDLHIGTPDGYSVVEQPAVLALLLEELANCERLVLLGDLVELLHARAERSFEIAEPILHALGDAIGPDGEIVYVPGNHDRALIRGWIREQGDALAREAAVPLDATAALTRVTDALRSGGADVTVRYPGVWLSPRIWAHHGHYLNHYVYPHQAYGLLRPRRGEPDTMRPVDFEPQRRPPAAIGAAPRVGGAAPAPTPHTHAPKDPPIVPVKHWHSDLHDRLLHSRISGLTSRLLGAQVRHHAVPAMARVATALGVDAEYVLFGHVHRRGPMAGDDLTEWNGDGHGPLIVNCGSWRWEPVLVGEANPPHPYWPGGAIVIESDGIPRTIDLLEGLDRTVLVPQTSTGVKTTE